MILKTIHEYFNNLWKEHSSKKMYLRYPSFRRVSPGLNATNSICLDFHNTNFSNVSFTKKNKRNFRFKRMPRIISLFKLVTISKSSFNRMRKIIQISAKQKPNSLIYQLYVRPRRRQSNPYWHSKNLLFIRRKVLKTRKRRKRLKLSRRFRLILSSKRLNVEKLKVKRKNIRALRLNENKRLPLSKTSLLNKLSTNTRGIYRAINYSKNMRTLSFVKNHQRSFLLDRKFKKYRRFYRFKKIKMRKKRLFLNLIYLKTNKLLNTKLKNKNYFHNNLSDLSAGVVSPTFSIGKTNIRTSNSTNSMIINYLSLFLNFRLIITNLNFNTEKFLIRKILYSFLKRNEVKKSIMERRRKIKAFRFYKKVYSSFNNKPLYKKSYSNPFYLSKITSRNSNLFSPKKTSTRLTNSRELFLPRIKFKPGYQRLWRQARSTIADNEGLRYIYQKQMTKHITKLSRKVNFYSFSMNESSIDKAILYSRLLPDLKTVEDFSKLGLISMNGWKVISLRQFTIPGDFIQLTISKWLSLYFRWLVTWANSNKSKFKMLVFRKGRASAYRLMKQRKQKSSHVPSWVHNSRFDMSDIKPNFEVDYFTMSSIVLYEPLLIDYYTPDDMSDHRHYIYRLYNWKYIT